MDLQGVMAMTQRQSDTTSSKQATSGSDTVTRPESLDAGDCFSDGELGFDFLLFNLAPSSAEGTFSSVLDCPQLGMGGRLGVEDEGKTPRFDLYKGPASCHHMAQR